MPLSEARKLLSIKAKLLFGERLRGVALDSFGDVTITCSLYCRYCALTNEAIKDGQLTRLISGRIDLFNRAPVQSTNLIGGQKELMVGHYEQTEVVAESHQAKPTIGDKFQPSGQLWWLLSIFVGANILAEHEYHVHFPHNR